MQSGYQKRTKHLRCCMCVFVRARGAMGTEKGDKQIDRRLRGISMWGGSEAVPRARNGPPRRRHLLHLRLVTPRIRFTDWPGRSFCSGEEKMDNRTSSSQSLHCNHGLNQSIAFSANVHDGHRAHAEAHLPPWPCLQTWLR